MAPILSKVLVLYTGGTIGMKLNENNDLAPAESGQFENSLRADPNFNGDSIGDYVGSDFLSLPAVTNERRRIIYKIKQHDKLIDSSNMGISDWNLIAKRIYDHRGDYDGFVVLQGTDTMSYTASALSFMFENLNKGVIITGSQKPIFETRSDGKENFISSLIIAALYGLTEVCVVFGNKLLRGNRTVKINCDSFASFYSPNFPPLGSIGVQIKVDYQRVIRPKSSDCLLTEMNTKTICLLRIVPEMPETQIRAALEEPVVGVVLQSFGAGNIPSDRKELLNHLKSAIDRGVIIVNCTQCLRGSVTEDYDASAGLRGMGVIFLGDITMEAAYTKLCHVLSKDISVEKMKMMMRTNLRGELTEN
ncbi:L-asparaginase-like [Drosophila tropicalis]|uniref:L-asparaginase-like n=1 Tax=Drosophila tropicalis TaxID=46794 RepID=UPI0035AB74AE